MTRKRSRGSTGGESGVASEPEVAASGGAEASETMREKEAGENAERKGVTRR